MITCPERSNRVCASWITLTPFKSPIMTAVMQGWQQ